MKYEYSARCLILEAAIQYALLHLVAMAVGSVCVISMFVVAPMICGGFELVP